MYDTIHSIAQQHPDQNVALFSHGTAIRQFLGKVKGTAPEQWKELPHFDNTAVTCLAWDGKSFHIVYEGDNSHLDESISTLARQSWWRKGGQKAEDVNLWFRPLDPEKEQELYLSARAGHLGSPSTARSSPLTAPASGKWPAWDLDVPWGVSVAMAGDQFAGMIQLDLEKFRSDGAGYIPLCYMAPDFRNRGLGVQLLGHAVSSSAGRAVVAAPALCLNNDHAMHFYDKYGFHKSVWRRASGSLWTYWKSHRPSKHPLHSRIRHLARDTRCPAFYTKEERFPHGI